MTEALIWAILHWIAALALATFLAVLIVRVFILFLEAMTRSKENSQPGIWIQANWGGLGGALSGWRISDAIIYLLLLSLLLGGLILAIVSLPSTMQTPPAGQNAGEQQKQKTETGIKNDQAKTAAESSGRVGTTDSATTDTRSTTPSTLAPSPKKASQ